jgi:hypothetical protein
LFFEKTLTRPASEQEAAQLIAFVKEDSTATTPEGRLEAWTRVCQIVLGSAEFRTLR